MATLLLILSLFLTHAQEDEWVKDDLAAHITTNAIVGPRWHTSLQRSPGANINTKFLLTSLSLVVYDRLEIGTVPAFYFEPAHQYNFSSKYYFWKGEEFHWSISSQIMRYLVQEDVNYDGQVFPFSFSLDSTSLQLAVNYLPTASRFNFGLALTQLLTHIELDVNGAHGQQDRGQFESGLDISYAMSRRFDLTVGIGYLRQAGITAYEKVNLGYGTSIRWKRPKKFFSSPMFGIHYTPETDTTMYLFSTKIL